MRGLIMTLAIAHLAIGCKREDNDQARWSAARDAFCNLVVVGKSDMKFNVAAMTASLAGIRATITAARSTSGDSMSRYGFIAGPCESFGFSLGRATAASDGNARVLTSIAKATPAREPSALFSRDIPRLDVDPESAIGLCDLANESHAAIDSASLQKAFDRSDELIKAIQEKGTAYDEGFDKLETACKQAGFDGRK